jgi:hypothetical protein
MKSNLFSTTLPAPTFQFTSDRVFRPGTNEDIRDSKASLELDTLMRHKYTRVIHVRSVREICPILSCTHLRLPYDHMHDHILSLHTTTNEDNDPSSFKGVLER